MTFDAEKFASRLRSRRAEIGITQQDLAESSELSPSTIFRYESAESAPSVESLLALCFSLKTSPSWLLGYESAA